MPRGWIEVLVDGELPADEVREFLGVHADFWQGATLLRGVVRDQAELVGMVARIEALPCGRPETSAKGPWTIRAQGRVREDLADWLEGFAVSHDGGCTVLIGPVGPIGPAGPVEGEIPAITEMLLHLQAAGLEVVDVRRKWLDDPDHRDQRL